eukprot:scaffold96845_cov40-Cyclotella_meneghiniana.AAC.2
MSHQGIKRQKHAPSSSGLSGPETSSPVASQWTQMRQEIMDSLRAELQNGLQSQVDQLKEKVARLEGEASRGEAEKLELKQSVDQLENENSQLKSKVGHLEEKVKSLDNLVNKAQRKEIYHGIMKINQQWKYPLALPTMGELMLDGYDEEESVEIIRQIAYIKHVTTQMRKCKVLNRIDVSDNPVEPYVFYEGMMAHYKQFADALIEYKHTIDYMEEGIFHFRMVGDSQLPARVLLLMQEALKHTHFHILDFYPFQIEGMRYLDFISNCVRESSRLQAFHLYNVSIENSRDIDLLCGLFSNKASLQEITLMSSGTQAGVFQEIFNKLRTKDVRKIDLSRNHLSNLRPTDMSEFLSSNPSLEELDLGSNPFNEQDIVYVADALRHNTTLCRLRFQFLRDHPTNLHLLESAIFDSTSLNAAHDSNHHCNLWLNTIVISDIRSFNTSNDPTLNRRKKIYTLLSKRNRRRENASFLEQDGIGIKHIPQILSLLKPFSEHYGQTLWRQEEDEVKPLSIAYEIMRDWRMPELYRLDQMEED